MGIDDFAFKTRMSYGTLFIDLESRRPVDLLNSRKHIHVTDWLKEHPEVELITRDGSRTYAKAVTEASSTILQVSDRWHILHQLFEAIKKTIFGLIPQKWTPNLTGKTVPVNAEVNVPLRKNDAIRIENEDKRWTRIQHVQSLYMQGYNVTAIKNKLHLSRGTVYADLRQKEKPNHQRGSPFDRFRPLIRTLLQERQTAKQIDQASRSAGFTGSHSTLSKIIAEERHLASAERKKSYSFRQKIIQVIWDFKNGEHLERFYSFIPIY